jgi:AraC-like DNA-binding protein
VERRILESMEKQAYTVAEVSALTGFSRQTVTRMFEGEKGVLIVARPETLRKRGYRNIRIPRAVYERVVRRLSV